MTERVHGGWASSSALLDITRRVSRAVKDRKSQFVTKGGPVDIVGHSVGCNQPLS